MMNAKFSVVRGFGIDLGLSRPSAVFSHDDYYYDGRPSCAPVEFSFHGYAAKGHEGAFLCVSGTTRKLAMDEVFVSGDEVDPKKIESFAEWCRSNGIQAGEPKWLVGGYVEQR